jgi:hypothetical protein
MKHVSNTDQYKVHENVREDDQNYEIDNHGTVGIGYIDQKTLTYHGGPSVNVDTKKLEGQEYKQCDDKQLQRRSSRLYVWQSV